MLWPIILWWSQPLWFCLAKIVEYMTHFNTSHLSWPDWKPLGLMKGRMGVLEIRKMPFSYRRADTFDPLSALVSIHQLSRSHPTLPSSPPGTGYLSSALEPVELVQWPFCWHFLHFEIHQSNQLLCWIACFNYTGFWTHSAWYPDLTILKTQGSRVIPSPFKEETLNFQLPQTQHLTLKNLI